MKFYTFSCNSITCSCWFKLGLGKSIGITPNRWRARQDRMTSPLRAGVTKASTLVVRSWYVAWNVVDPVHGTSPPSTAVIFFLLERSRINPHASIRSSETMLCWQPVSGNTSMIDGLSLPLIGLTSTFSINGVGSESSMTLVEVRLHWTTLTRPVLDPACEFPGLLKHTLPKCPTLPHLEQVTSLALHWSRSG